MYFDILITKKDLILLGMLLLELIMEGIVMHIRLRHILNFIRNLMLFLSAYKIFSTHQ